MKITTGVRNRMGRPLAALIGGVALSLAACVPLPIPHTSTITPPIVGTLRWRDSSPVSGAAVAVTGSRDDSLCARPTAIGTSDSHGQFRLVAGKRTRTILWVPLQGDWDLTARDYWLCTGLIGSDRMVTYHSRTPVLGRVKGDTLTCTEWVVRDERRSACVRQPPRHFQIGR
jgi:hypothetical protein